jgi:hypothetical protein
MIDDNSQNRVILNFDYLDPQDGAVVELLHTDSVRDPFVKGTIRGVPKGMLDRGSRSIPRGTLRIPNITKFTRGLTIGFVLVGLMCIAFALGASDRLLRLADNREEPMFAIRLVLLVTGVIYTALGGLFLFSFRRRYPKQLRYTDDIPPA